MGLKREFELGANGLTIPDLATMEFSPFFSFFLASIISISLMESPGPIDSVVVLFVVMIHV